MIGADYPTLSDKLPPVLMYDSELQTFTQELTGPTGATILSGTDRKYITGVAIQQSGVASTSEILCGTTVVARNYGKDFSYVPMQKLCESDIIVAKTGQDSSSFIVNVTRRNLQLVKFQYTTTNPATESAEAIHGSLYTIWIGLGLLVFSAFWLVGIKLFRR